MQQNDRMNRKKHLWWIGSGCLILLLLTMLRKPVLLHIGDGSCACADADITGFILLNPVRDRSPEQSAELFLKNVRNGNCSADDLACIAAIEKHRVSSWTLKNRDDDHGSVELYFAVTEQVPTNPLYTESGEGTVDLVRREGIWVVTNYSSVF